MSPTGLRRIVHDHSHMRNTVSPMEFPACSHHFRNRNELITSSRFWQFAKKTRISFFAQLVTQGDTCVHHCYPKTKDSLDKAMETF